MTKQLPATPEPMDALANASPVGSAPGTLDRHARPEQDAAATWRRYLGAVVRYKWILAAGTILGAVGGVVVARTVKPEYVAQATIWIETTDSRRGQSEQGPIRSEQLFQAAGWMELLRSYVVLDEAVRRVRLHLHFSRDDAPLFEDFRLQGSRFSTGTFRLVVGDDGGTVTLATVDGVPIETVPAGDSLGQELGFGWAPPTSALRPGRTVVFEVERPRDAARALARSLKTRNDKDGNFLRVELSGTDPDLITATVNAVAERHVEVAAELKRAKLTELAKILGEQLQRADSNLREVEMELESFRVRTVTLPAEQASPVAGGIELTLDPVMEHFFGMKVEWDELAQDRDTVRDALAKSEEGELSVDALEIIPAVQQSTEVKQALSELTQKQAELRALQYRYTEDHPAVDGLAGEVEALGRTTVPSSTWTRSTRSWPPRR